MQVQIFPTQRTDVTLYLQHQSGCSYESTFTISLEVAEPALYIPNVFSSNDDNVNDLWTVDFRDFPSNEVYLYDRWGNLVGHWANASMLAWDGTSRSKPVAEGVYVYRIRYEDYVKYGDVTVVR